MQNGPRTLKKSKMSRKSKKSLTSCCEGISEVLQHLHTLCSLNNNKMNSISFSCIGKKEKLNATYEKNKIQRKEASWINRAR